MALTVNGGSLQFIAEIENSDFGRSIRQMEEQLRGLTQTANAQSSEMEGFAKKASLAIGSYLSLNAASDFVKQLIDVRSQFQTLDVSFSTMLKSKSKADALMSDVVKLAATTPFTLQEVGQGAKQLLAYGTEAGKVVGTLKTLGDVASGVGAPIGDLVYLYGTLQTQGRAYTRDIMQFTSRGIPIIDELAKQFGVTKDKVQELVEAGKVGFPEVEKAFQSLTGQGGIFYNLMDKQSKTLNGQISNLSDSFSQMLNEIGKSQEGILAGGIGGLKTLVDNYENVLDILKLIVVAYGSYRAVLVATAASQALQERMALQAALAGQTLSKSQLAAATATRILDGAFKTLYRTIASAAPVLALTAVTAAIYAMVTTSNAAAKALETIADIQTQAAQAAAKEKDTIEQLLSVYNDRNKSDADHATALQKLIALNPTYLSGLNANNIATKEGQTIIQNYLKSLEDKAKGEAAYAAKQANLLKIVDLQTKGIGAVDNTERLGRSLKRFFTAQKDLSGIEEDKAIVQGMIKELKLANDEIDKTFKEQITKTILGDTGPTNAAAEKARRTLAQIEADISKKKEEQKADSTTRAQFLQYEKEINALEKEAEAIRGANKKHLKEQESLEAKINALIEKRKSLLEQLAALKEGSRLTGVTKEESEVDKINNKYAQAVKDIDEYNKKVEEFNKKNKTKVATIGNADLSLLNDAKVFEVQNARYRQQAEAFKKGLDEQKDIYTQYEEAKKNIGIDKAEEMFAGQKQGFTSYIDYLKDQQLKLVADITVNGPNVGNTGKLTSVNTELAQKEKEQSKAAINRAIEDYKRVLDATKTFNSQRLALEKKYQKDVETAKKNFTGEDLQARLNILDDTRKTELDSLQENLSQQSELYQNLNKEIVKGTVAMFQERKKEIQKALTDGFVTNKITNEQIPLTKAQIEQLKKVLQDTNNTINAINAQKFEEISKYAALASQSLHSLASAIAPMNAGLADTLDTMGDIADVAANAAASVSGFATGNVAQGISGGIAAITGVIKLFTSAKESQKKAQAELEAYQFRILEGEITVNQTYRERLRTQVEINKLKIQGINDENNLLQQQQTQLKSDYQKIFDLIQNESKIIGEHTEKQGGFLGIARKTVVVQDLQSLGGSSYDDLEKLFLSGALTEKAKQLFEELQKLKQEGVDIDAALEENKRKAQELFTGTTSDSILDSIVQGFADGKRATEDFADSFEDLMKKAILNSIKYQALEKPLKDFYDQFAADAQSGGSLDTVEIDRLKNSYNEILENANKKFEELQKVTNVNFSSATSGNNTLSGAIKGITATQADLLAGQFGAFRVSNLEILATNNQQLFTLNRIEANTAETNTYLASYFRKWDMLGLKVNI